MHRHLKKHEYDFLLACCRTTQTPRSKDMIQNAIQRGIEWENILTTARRNEITPLIYYSLPSCGVQALLPRTVLDTLHNAYFFNVKRNILLQKELSRILKYARDSGIGIIALKGIALLQTIYRDPGVRVMTDIDILIREQDLRRTIEICSNNGYTLSEKYQTQLRSKFRDNYETALYKKLNPHLYVYLEIHTSLFSARPYPISLPLWQRKEPCAIDGQGAFVLSTEDTLLSLLLHIRRHIRRVTLKFIVDINEFLNAYGNTIDWPYIEQACRSIHIRNTVYLGLYLTHALLDNANAARVKNRFKPNPAVRVILRMCLNKDNFLSAGIVRKSITRILAFDSMTDIIRYVARVVIRERMSMMFLARTTPPSA